MTAQKQCTDLCPQRVNTRMPGGSPAGSWSGCIKACSLGDNKPRQQITSSQGAAYIGTAAEVAEILSEALPSQHAKDMAKRLRKALKNLSIGDVTAVRVGTSGLVVVALFPGHFAILCPPTTGKGHQ